MYISTKIELWRISCLEPELTLTINVLRSNLVIYLFAIVPYGSTAIKLYTNTQKVKLENKSIVPCRTMHTGRI